MMRFDRTKRHREAQIPENFPGAHFCSVAWLARQFADRRSSGVDLERIEREDDASGLDF